MSPTAHRLKVERTARFVVEGDLATAHEAWFVLHGYGQLANSFLADCAPLVAPNRAVIAPEALSRFYLREGRGPVGASWMTSEDRDDEIADYVAALDAIVARVRELGLAPAAKLRVLGFSQGVATAVRWIALGSQVFERVVLWSGTLAPKDLERMRATTKFGALPVVAVLGARDAVIGVQDFHISTAMIAAAGATVTRRSFDGGHRLDRELLGDLAR